MNAASTFAHMASKSSDSRGAAPMSSLRHAQMREDRTWGRGLTGRWGRRLGEHYLESGTVTIDDGHAPLLAVVSEPVQQSCPCGLQQARPIHPLRRHQKIQEVGLRVDVQRPGTFDLGALGHCANHPEKRLAEAAAVLQPAGRIGGPEAEGSSTADHPGRRLSASRHRDRRRSGGCGSPARLQLCSTSAEKLSRAIFIPEAPREFFGFLPRHGDEVLRSRAAVKALAVQHVCRCKAAARPRPSSDPKREALPWRRGRWRGQEPSEAERQGSTCR